MNLETNLPLLEANQLIRRLDEEEWAYLFKHTLVQETVYTSLLKTDRKQLHYAAARAVERAYPQQLDENAALLARHYAEAGDQSKTFEYSLRAGERALRVNAYAEALMHFDCARQVHASLSPDPSMLIRLYTQRGRTLEHQGRQKDAVENYQELRALSQARTEPRLELAALLALAALFATPTPVIDLERAQELSDRALTLARALNDREAEARVLWNLMLREYFSGHPLKALEYGEQALALARAEGLRERLAYTLNDISRVYVAVGRMNEGLAAQDEALALWKELDNLPMLADNLATSADNYLTRGNLDRALELAEQADHLSEQINNPWNRAYSHIIIIQILVERGEIARAFGLMDSINRWAIQSGFMIALLVVETVHALVLAEFGAIDQGINLLRRPQTTDPQSARMVDAWVNAALARLEVGRGAFAKAHASLQVAREATDPNDLSTLSPLIVAVTEAELAFTEGEYNQVLAVTSEWIERLNRFGISIFSTDLLYHQGRAYLAQGELDAAERVLDDAQRTAEAVNTRRLLWHIYAARADLETRRGHAAAAAQFRAQARAVIEYIVAHAPRELRAGFLDTPAVRQILEVSSDGKTMARG